MALVLMRGWTVRGTGGGPGERNDWDNATFLEKNTLIRLIFSAHHTGDSSICNHHALQLL